jgi:hypothetical protein
MSGMVLPSPRSDIGRLTGTVRDRAMPSLLAVRRVRLVADLVQELVQCLADPLEPSRIHSSQIRAGDVPRLRRGLVFDEPVFYRWAVNPRISLGIAEQ